MNNQDKIKLLRKYFKKNDNFIELIFNDYENIDYYIRLDYNPSKKANYLYSINLKLVDKHFKKYINQEIIRTEAINYILDAIYSINYGSTDLSKNDKNLVEITIVNDTVNMYKFNKYIPRELFNLSTLVIFLASNLPFRMQPLFEELLADINGTKFKYEYKEPFKFDLRKTKITDAYNDVVFERGLDIYRQDKVEFLEQFENKYLALVEGHDNYAYVVQIVDNKEDKTIIATCTCPCEFHCKHEVAVIEAIRNKEFNKFFKVRIIKQNETSLDRLLDISNSLLCIGAFQDKIQVLDANFNIVNVNILNSNGTRTFEIIEDNDENELSNYVEKIENGEVNERD